MAVDWIGCVANYCRHANIRITQRYIDADPDAQVLVVGMV